MKTEVEEVVVVLRCELGCLLCMLVRCQTHPKSGQTGDGVECGFDEIFDRAILQEAVHLVLWYTQSVPIERATISMTARASAFVRSS